jgi:hypothetical protein
MQPIVKLYPFFPRKFILNINDLIECFFHGEIPTFYKHKNDHQHQQNIFKFLKVFGKKDSNCYRTVNKQMIGFTFISFIFLVISFLPNSPFPDGN